MFWCLQCVAVCCSVLQCVAVVSVLCSVLPCAAVCCSDYRVWLCVAVHSRVLPCVAVYGSVLRYVAVCCIVIHCVAVCCSVMQFIALCCRVLCTATLITCCSVLQYVAERPPFRHAWQACLQSVTVRCSALQCVAMCCSVLQRDLHLSMHGKQCCLCKTPSLFCCRFLLQCVTVCAVCCSELQLDDISTKSCPTYDRDLQCVAVGSRINGSFHTHQ